ncbi:MAG TPA: DNA-directed RNA polymerase subunit alpha C-terminal domain-containing protein, partial [Kofleriaceae bacterium]|nr:DNA-directed RNA polymerase subunit alpha C-terminal domain-containing protein [Kofleriaceae bacterium]
MKEPEAITLLRRLMNASNYEEGYEAGRAAREFLERRDAQRKTEPRTWDDLSCRPANALRWQGIENLEQLFARGRDRLLRLKNVGRKTRAEYESVLRHG